MIADFHPCLVYIRDVPANDFIGIEEPVTVCVHVGCIIMVRAGVATTIFFGSVPGTTPIGIRIAWVCFSLKGTAGRSVVAPVLVRVLFSVCEVVPVGICQHGMCCCCGVAVRIEVVYLAAVHHGLVGLGKGESYFQAVMKAITVRVPFPWIRDGRVPFIVVITPEPEGEPHDLVPVADAIFIAVRVIRVCPQGDIFQVIRESVVVGIVGAGVCLEVIPLVAICKSVAVGVVIKGVCSYGQFEGIRYPVPVRVRLVPGCAPAPVTTSLDIIIHTIVLPAVTTTVYDLRGGGLEGYPAHVPEIDLSPGVGVVCLDHTNIILHRSYGKTNGETGWDVR